MGDRARPYLKKKKAKRTIQDGRLLTSRDCSSQRRRRELEDATLSDKFWWLAEQKIPQWRKHTGGQRDSRSRRSGSTGTSAWQRSEQSKQVRRTHKGPRRTPEPGAAAATAPWRGSARRRVNGTGSPSDRGLEPQEGRVAHYGHKKEARQENPGQKSTISFNAAALALGTNNLVAHSRDLI